MVLFLRRPAVLLLVCLLIFPSNALVSLSPVRLGDIRTFDRRAPRKTFQNEPPSRRILVGPRHVRVESEKDRGYSLVKRFLMSLSKGIFFALPMRPSLAQTLFGIKAKRKNETKNPASSSSASVAFTLRECFLYIGLYLLLGICAYSVMMEHWSLVDAV